MFSPVGWESFGIRRMLSAFMAMAKPSFAAGASSLDRSLEILLQRFIPELQR